MARIALAIKTPFGEINVSGDSPKEVLDALAKLDQNFVTEVNDRVTALLVTQAKDDLRGVIEIGRDGPIIVTKKKLSHYASIGLILYSLREHQASSREITKRLAASGKKVTVPARLHEMGDHEEARGEWEEGNRTREAPRDEEEGAHLQACGPGPLLQALH
jgi:hypothetical protein